jgi:hypothetical protein
MLTERIRYTETKTARSFVPYCMTYAHAARLNSVVTQNILVIMMNLELTKRFMHKERHGHWKE